MTSCQARPFTAVLKQCLAPTCTGSQIRSFSQSDTACGDPCSDIFALVAFELAPVKGVMLMQINGEQDNGLGPVFFFFFFGSTHFFCVLTSHRGRVGGLQGSFSIKDLIRFRPPSRPSCQLRADFKGVGGNQTALYPWASILSCAGFSVIQNTNAHSSLLHVF